MVKKRSPVKVPPKHGSGGDVDMSATGDKEEDGGAAKKKQRYDVSDLLTKVNELLENFNYELALQFSEKALALEPANTEILETIGNIHAELNDVSRAREHYMKAVNIKPDEGHVKYLYLGQLSQGGDAVKFYEKAIVIMKSIVTEDESQGVGKRDISNVYCSLAELYMTDCCMEEGAEQSCKRACEQAIEIDAENPEAYLVMCNFVLTTGDMDSAKNICIKVYELWESLSTNNEDDDSAIVELMSYESRMTLMKLLIEVELCEKVPKLGVQMLEENEDDIRIWYYIGYSKSLINEVDGQRHYLDTALYLYEKNHENDEEMLQHIKELLDNCPPDDVTEEEEEGKEDEEEEEGDTPATSAGGMDVDMST